MIRRATLWIDRSLLWRCKKIKEKDDVLYKLDIIYIIIIIMTIWNTRQGHNDRVRMCPAEKNLRHRTGTWPRGPSIKYVTLFLMIFDPLPPPLSQTVTNLGPPLKVCHTSEQKVNKQISRMETALNNYNCYYYILNNNIGLLGVSNKPWNTLKSSIFLQLRRW